EPVADEPGSGCVGLSGAKQVGGELLAAEGAAAGADADVLAAREPDRGAGTAAEPGVASAERAGVDAQEDAARNQGDAQRVAPGPARQSGQEPECRVAAPGVQGDQSGAHRDGRPVDGPPDSPDCSAAETA